MVSSLSRSLGQEPRLSVPALCWKRWPGQARPGRYRHPVVTMSRCRHRALKSAGERGDRGGERFRLFPVWVMPGAWDHRHRGAGDFGSPGFTIRCRNDADPARPRSVALGYRSGAAIVSVADCAYRASSRTARAPLVRGRWRRVRCPAVPRNLPFRHGISHARRRNSARGMLCMSAMSRSSTPPTLIPSGAESTRPAKRRVSRTAISAAIQPPKQAPASTACSRSSCRARSR